MTIIINWLKTIIDKIKDKLSLLYVRFLFAIKLEFEITNKKRENGDS